MTACNERPPEGHPFHGTLVACHLPDYHLEYDEPHSWDIEAAVARQEIVARSLQRIRERFPEREIEQFDTRLPHPIEAWDVDEHGERTGDRPYRRWEQAAGPWLIVRFVGGEELAIWKTNGDVYRIRPSGAVEDEPIF